MAIQNENVRLITRTALLLAVTLLFQYLRAFIPGTGTLISTLIIGSLVNLGLQVAAVIVGWRGSVVISVMTPIVAFLQGHLALPVLIPFVAAGNIVLVLAFEFMSRRMRRGKASTWLALAAAAGLKALFLWLTVARFFTAVILPGQVAAENGAKMSNALGLSFGWPQLVTALVGGTVAMILIPALRKAMPEQAAPHRRIENDSNAIRSGAGSMACESGSLPAGIIGSGYGLNNVRIRPRGFPAGAPPLYISPADTV
jgi:hypothetical protein